MTITTNVAKEADAASLPGNKLGALLLELAGKSAGRMITARRHIDILTQAYPLLDKSQQNIARRRIQTLEERWGPMLRTASAGGDGNVIGLQTALISPELRIAQWLSKRKHWGRYLMALYRAACFFQRGGTCLSDAMDFAFAHEMEDEDVMVGVSSFTEWMAELRIADRTGRREFGPGQWCEWWAAEMKPTTAQDTAYTACLLLATEIERKRLQGNRDRKRLRR